MIRSFFPIFDKLTAEEQAALQGAAELQTFQKGDIVHTPLDCTGLLLIRTGQLRAHITSAEGRELTVYRLLERDICLFSASCMLNSIQFDITISAEKDTEAWLIPVHVYKRLMEHSAPLANYTNEIMAARFSEVMWLIEQVLWKSMDKRIAAFLLEESRLEGSPVLKITHETIANHLGTHREVVTRLLRFLQEDGLLALRRGEIELLQPEKLDK